MADPAEVSQSGQIIVQSGSSYGPWITFGAILISAIIGACVALRSISEQRRIARKRATLDILVQKEWDSDYIAARAEFVKLRDGPDGLDFWAQNQHKNSPQTVNIRNTLNDYELIAIGIKEDILDEELYKRWFKTSFLRDWRAAQGFIREIRRQLNTPTLFTEMDWLAQRWGENVQMDLPLETGPTEDSN